MSYLLRVVGFVFACIAVIFGWAVLLAHFFGGEVPLYIHTMAAVWSFFVLERIAKKIFP